LLAVLAITLVANTAAIAFNTSVASAATFDPKTRGMCWSTATAARITGLSTADGAAVVP
jgi:hypothetical protein